MLPSAGEVEAMDRFGMPEVIVILGAGGNYLVHTRDRAFLATAATLKMRRIFGSGDAAELRSAR
jgi:hypothetical protein